MDRVPTRATGIPRSKKKLVELCRKRVVLISDTLTKKKTNATGATIVFSATVGQQPSPLVVSSRADLN